MGQYPSRHSANKRQSEHKSPISGGVLSVAELVADENFISSGSSNPVRPGGSSPPVRPGGSSAPVRPGGTSVPRQSGISTPWQSCGSAPVRQSGSAPSGTSTLRRSRHAESPEPLQALLHTAQKTSCSWTPDELLQPAASQEHVGPAPFFNPLRFGSTQGVDRSTAAIVDAMHQIDFFTTQVGQSAIPVLAARFALCEFGTPGGGLDCSDEPILRRGDDAGFVGVIVSGALTIKHGSTPLYSLAKDDTLGEAIVAVTRNGRIEDDVYVRSPGTMLVTTLQQLEVLNLLAPGEYQRLMDAFVARCIARSITEANYQPVSSTRVEGPFVALVAHDAKKTALQDFCLANRETLARCKLTGTSTTCAMLLEKCSLRSSYKLPSGPLGGDQCLGALIAHDLVDAVFFFKDSLSIQCHYSDIEALCQLCDVRNVPHATNAVTAAAVIKYTADLMDLRQGIIRVNETLPTQLVSELKDPQMPSNELVRRLARKPTKSIMMQGSTGAVRQSPSARGHEQVALDVSGSAPPPPSTPPPPSLPPISGGSSGGASAWGSSGASRAPTELGLSCSASPRSSGARVVDCRVEDLVAELRVHESISKTFSPAELELLAETLQLVELPRGAQLFREGEVADSAFVVLRGRVELVRARPRLTRTVRVDGRWIEQDGGDGEADGDEEGHAEPQVLLTIGAGDMHGQSQVMLEKPISSWQLGAEAARHSRVAVLSRKELLRIRRRNPDFYARINLWLGLMILQGRDVDKVSELNRKYIIVTCDNTPRAKAALFDLIILNKDYLLRHQEELIGPSDIAQDIYEATGLTFMHTVQEPFLGGAMELGDLVSRSRVRAAVILRDYQAEQRAFEALLRITDLYAVPSATNPATGDIVFRYLETLPLDQ